MFQFTSPCTGRHHETTYAAMFVLLMMRRLMTILVVGQCDRLLDFACVFFTKLRRPSSKVGAYRRRIFGGYTPARR